MRIFLLRILIGWWAIIGAWCLLYPLFYLLSGHKEASEYLRHFSNGVWNGV